MSRAKTKPIRETMGSRRPAIPKAIVPKSIVEQTKAFTGPRGRLEMGGVLIGHVDGDGNNVVVAGIFPRQTEETPGYCEFEGKWMTIACAAADYANESVRAPDGKKTPTLRVIGWIHTHPGLDIFLSGIDVATYKQMLSASPDGRFVAVVVDPLMGKDGVFLTPEKPNTFSSANGTAKLDATLRERYLAFLGRIESVREKRGREEVPFIITGDLHRDHVSRGFSDDYMMHNLDAIHFTKMEVNGIRDDISALSSDLDEMRRELRRAHSEISMLGEVSRKTKDNSHSINDLERSLRSTRNAFSEISSRVGGLEKSVEGNSEQNLRLRREVSDAETRIDREISNITNDVVELSENQEKDHSNILQVASLISGLERSVEVQGLRNAQLGDIVQKIGSMASKPRRTSRKQIEKEEWDVLHSKLRDPEVSNSKILRDHFSLIAMNRGFCLAAFKSIRENPRNQNDNQFSDIITQFTEILSSSLRKFRSLIEK